MKTIILVILMLLLSNGIIRSQLNPEWVKIYNGSGDNNDEALSQAVDQQGNVYATGKIYQSASLFDIYLAKYNSSGNVLWERIYNGPGNGNDVANSVTLDQSGNIYVTGESRGSDSQSDYILIKFNSQGDQLWERRYNGTSNSVDVAVKVKTDNSGNPVITGRSYETASLFDIVTIKFNSDGDVQWTKRYNGLASGNEFADDLALDESGNVHISGSSLVQGAVNDFLLIKYSAAGDELWTAGYNGPANGNDDITSLAVDLNGNVIITGSSVGTGTSLDFATIKYSQSGTELWLRRYTSAANSSPDEPKAITFDNNGNIFVTGTSVEFNSYDFLTIKYSPSGDELWTGRYNGNSAINFDEPRSLTADNSGNVYVAGLSQGTGTMDDMVIIKYDADGNQIWFNRYNSPENKNDIANNIDLDVSGNLIVSGIIAGASTQNDFAVIKFSQLTNINQISNEIASGFYLQQNYPNPFNPSTVIRFTVPETSEINLSVFDNNGKLMEKIVSGILTNGEYSYNFNAAGLPGGIYFYRLKNNKQTITRKMIILK